MARRNNPETRSLPQAEWPADDRAAYAAAVRTGNVLTDAGPAARLALATLKGLINANGRWLGFLMRSGRFDLLDPPARRATAANLEAFVEHLRITMKAVSVWSTVSYLYTALRVMFPAEDWRWMRPAINRLRSQAVLRRDLTNKLVPPRKMFRAGIRLMESAGDASRSIWRATRFRDGLMLALQAARALRTKNLAGMTTGGTLVRVGDGYVIVFPAEAMKGGRRPFEVPVPARLTPYLDRYLTEIRPMLLQGKTSDAFWITQYGKPMAPKAIYDRLVKVTLRLFGKAMSPHMFRHALATSIALEDPAHVRMAMPMLHHSTFDPTDRHYIQAQSIQASRGWNAHLDHLRGRKSP